MKWLADFQTKPPAGKCSTDGFATLNPGKYPVRDVIFSAGARNESRVLSLMSALSVNSGTPATRFRLNFSDSVGQKVDVASTRSPSRPIVSFLRIPFSAALPQGCVSKLGSFWQKVKSTSPRYVSFSSQHSTSLRDLRA
jgi:hypothetical protein